MALIALFHFIISSEKNDLHILFGQGLTSISLPNEFPSGCLVSWHISGFCLARSNPRAPNNSCQDLIWEKNFSFFRREQKRI